MFTQNVTSIGLAWAVPVIQTHNTDQTAIMARSAAG